MLFPETRLDVALNVVGPATKAGSLALSLGKSTLFIGKEALPLLMAGIKPATKALGKLDARMNARAFELFSKEGKSFYHPHEIRSLMETRYPGQVLSTTVPDSSLKNVKLAGQRHPVTGIVFDQRGFPIFDDVMIFETKIAREASSIRNERLHMRTATKDLRENINSGKISPHEFTRKQLEDIQAGRDRIDGFTWHHHQETGRMQLIPREIYQQTGHVGGMEIWVFTK